MIILGSIRRALRHLFAKRAKCTRCGKPCELYQQFKIPGDEKGGEKIGHLRQPESEHYCAECLTASCIRCAWCGESIAPGEAISLYTPVGDFVIPEYAVVYSKEPIRLVGCLSFDCMVPGCARDGFWFPPGRVYPDSPRIV